VTVVDFWRILGKGLAEKPNINYVPIGLGVEDEADGAPLAELWGDTSQ